MFQLAASGRARTLAVCDSPASERSCAAVKRVGLFLLRVSLFGPLFGLCWHSFWKPSEWYQLKLWAEVRESVWFYACLHNVCLMLLMDIFDLCRASIAQQKCVDVCLCLIFVSSSSALLACVCSLTSIRRPQWTQKSLRLWRQLNSCEITWTFSLKTLEVLYDFSLHQKVLLGVFFLFLCNDQISVMYNKYHKHHLVSCF